MAYAYILCVCIISSLEIINLSCDNIDIECALVEIAINSKTNMSYNMLLTPNNSNYDGFQTQLLTKLSEATETADDVILWRSEHWSQENF